MTSVADQIAAPSLPAGTEVAARNAAPAPAVSAPAIAVPVAVGVVAPCTTRGPEAVAGAVEIVVGWAQPGVADGHQGRPLIGIMSRGCIVE